MNPNFQESTRPHSDLAPKAEPQAAPPGRQSHASRLDAGEREPRGGDHRELMALFGPEMAEDFRSRWDAVQGTFVDDPRGAVRRGDELVAEVMQNLEESFAHERAQLEGQLEQNDDAATENLRLALRRYRSFFERLLTL